VRETNERRYPEKRITKRVAAVVQNGGERRYRVQNPQNVPRNAAGGKRQPYADPKKNGGRWRENAGGESITQMETATKRVRENVPGRTQNVPERIVQIPNPRTKIWWR